MDIERQNAYELLKIVSDESDGFFPIFEDIDRLQPIKDALKESIPKFIKAVSDYDAIDTLNLKWVCFVDKYSVDKSA